MTKSKLGKIVIAVIYSIITVVSIAINIDADVYAWKQVKEAE